MKSLREFLSDTKNINFLRLWLAQFVSQFGDRIHQMALVGLVAHRFPNSAIELAKIMAFTILPVFIIQPFAGVYVDRWDRRKTLFVCDIIRGLLVLTIPFVFMVRESMVPIYIVVFLIFSFSRLYIPAKMSFIPELVDQENLLIANSLMTTTGMIAFALGASLGGFLIEKLGPRSGFICGCRNWAARWEGHWPPSTGGESGTAFWECVFCFPMGMWWKSAARS